MQDSGQQWLHWWTQACWQRAAPGWHQLPFFQLDDALRQRLALTQQTAVAALLDLPDALPGFPDDRVLKLAQASAGQRQQILALAGEICQRDSAVHRLDDAQRLWCQRISRALRPGLWLPPGLSFTPDPQPAALALLAALLPAASWSRLRLSFDYQAVMASPAMVTALPIGKLQALWDAVIWRSQQPEGQHDVDNQTA